MKNRQNYVVKTTTKVRPWTDAYYWLMTASWSKFLGVLAGLFLGVNLIFAFLYSLIDGFEGNPTHSFLNDFFFSVYTLATVGYGNMYPIKTLTQCVVTAEIMLGLLLIATTTGLMFSKFSLPKAKVIFSEVAVIGKRNGVPTLTFRLANERGAHVAEAQIKVALIKPDVTLEGEKSRKIFDLHLIRDNTPVFVISWSVFHPIDESSPLFGVTPEQFQQEDMTLVATLIGHDASVSQDIHARNLYRHQDLKWNARFIDSLKILKDGTLHLEFKKFHRWESQSV